MYQLNIYNLYEPDMEVSDGTCRSGETSSRIPYVNEKPLILVTVAEIEGIVN